MFGRTIGLFVALGLSGMSAHAADIAPWPAKAPAMGPALGWNWSGFYFGGHLGGGLGASKIHNPFGPSIYGDVIRMPKAFAGVQAGYNWQAANSPWIIGIEADVSAVDGDGTNTCLAYSGQFVSANCRVQERAFGSITGRVGRAFGSQGRALAYIKGGAAFLVDDISITTNAPDYLAQASNSASGTRLGWTLGAGVEYALSPAWSVRAEYDYARFGRRSIDAPGGGFLTTPFDPTSLTNMPGQPTHATQDMHLLKVGLNYHFGRTADDGAKGAASLPVKAAAPVSLWQFDVGARYWYSRGRYQNDLSMNTMMAQQNHLISRLTYESTGHSGEVFWRIDSPQKLFVKGFAGLGGLTSGRMNDEDWFPTDLDSPMAYSNTYHGKVTGSIAYATLDIGVDLFTDAWGKIGVFAGYNFYRDRKDSFGCAQIALPDARSICGVHEPLSTLAISQNEDWHSVRLGVNGSLAVAPGVKLAVDAAYLPYAHISALDVHHNRTEMPSPNSPAWGNGRGVQLEAILTYDVSPSFSVGVGARYWAMWATDVLTAGFGSPTPTETLPIRVERYGTFLQASYKFEVR